MKYLIPLFLVASLNVSASGIDTSGAWDRAAFAQSSAGATDPNAFWDDIKAAITDTDY